MKRLLCRLLGQRIIRAPMSPGVDFFYQEHRPCARRAYWIHRTNW